MSNELTPFQKRVRDLREERGLKKDEFAKLVNLSESTINAMERGYRKPIKTSIEKIADSCGVNPAWLRYGPTHAQKKIRG